MNEINKLSVDISNKIAAGEVAESPYHVVKELVENALDAGATVIHVAIQNGGLGSIIIRDNGIGVLPQDMPNTVKRFCTSKVDGSYDLSKITTMGFRGEALAAISSVSEFEMHSMRKGYDAKRLTINPDGSSTITDAEPISGTRVIVKNLFFNVPARRKFMKTPGHYTREITRFVKLFATVNLAIEVKLSCDARETFLMKAHLPFNARAAQTLDNNNILVAQIESDEATVSTATTDPTIQKPRRNGIMFAINGRIVVDPYLTNAVVQAYHRLIPANTYPMAIVSIVIRGSEIDVNVHPNKLEIRLLNQRSIFSLVHRCVLKALADANMHTVANATTPPPATTLTYPSGNGSSNGSDNGNLGSNSQSNSNPYPAARGVYPSNDLSSSDANRDELYLKNINKYKGNNPLHANNPLAGVYSSQYGKSQPMATATLPMEMEMGMEMGMEMVAEANINSGSISGVGSVGSVDATLAPTVINGGGDSITEHSIADHSIADHSIAEHNIADHNIADHNIADRNIADHSIAASTNIASNPLTALAQLGNMFILCSNNADDLVIVDQHIAHERVLYENLQAKQNTHKPTVRLHTPVELAVSQEEGEALHEFAETLTEKGFVIAVAPPTNANGNATASILQTPMEISKTDVGAAVRRILSDLIEQSPLRGLDKTSMSLSCRKAIKAGDPLELFEMQDLLNQLAQTSNPLTCPHGRPIMVPITAAKIRTMFGR